MKSIELNTLSEIIGGDYCSRINARLDRLGDREVTDRRTRRINKQIRKLGEARCSRNGVSVLNPHS